MAKRSRNKLKWKLRFFYFLLAVCSVGAIGVLILVALLPGLGGKPYAVSDSRANLKLMNKALEKRDPSICDGIKGGINDGDGIRGNSTIPEMTESQAKEHCRNEASQKPL